MTATADPPAGAAVTPVVLTSRPGIVERLYTVGTITLLSLGMPWDWGREAGGAIPGDEFFWFVTLTGFCWFMVLNFRSIGFAARQEWLVPLFVLWACASTLWSHNQAATTREAFWFVLTTLFSWYVATRYGMRDIARLIGAAMAIVVVVNVVFSVAGGGTDELGRWTGSYSNKNTYGQVSALATVAFWVNMRDAVGQRARWFVLLGLGSASVLLSFSKTALIAWGLLPGLVFVYRSFRARKTAYGAAVFATLTAVAFSVALSVSNIGRIASFFGKDPTVQGRIPLWNEIIDAFWDHPFLGAGYDAFWDGYFSPAHDVWLNLGWQPPHAHNAVLGFALELGVFAAAAYVLIAARGWSRAARLVQRNKGPLVMMPLLFITTIILLTISEELATDRALAWFLLVVMVALASHEGRIYNKRKVGVELGPTNAPPEALMQPPQGPTGTG